MANRKQVGAPKYLIYDGRFRFDEDRALVMDTADTIGEAKDACREQGDAVVVDADTGFIVWDPKHAEGPDR